MYEPFLMERILYFCDPCTADRFEKLEGTKPVGGDLHSWNIRFAADQSVLQEYVFEKRYSLICGLVAGLIVGAMLG